MYSLINKKNKEENNHLWDIVELLLEFFTHHHLAAIVLFCEAIVQQIIEIFLDI